MPRQNKPRSIGREEDLARRTAYEREQRGWSYAGLAARMTDVGCAIDPSALYKIENATPRRRISVDELVALSRIFRLPLQELLVPPEIAADRQAVRLVEDFQAARQAASDAFFALARHATAHPRVASIIDDLITPQEKRDGFDFAVDKWREKIRKESATGRVTDGVDSEET
ncbi:MAG: helix-turn-helix domain-containing protein [Nocardioidaceae bacterium]